MLITGNVSSQTVKRVDCRFVQYNIQHAYNWFTHQAYIVCLYVCSRFKKKSSEFKWLIYRKVISCLLEMYTHNKCLQFVCLLQQFNTLIQQILVSVLSSVMLTCDHLTARVVCRMQLKIRKYFIRDLLQTSATS